MPSLEKFISKNIKGKPMKKLGEILAHKKL
jgi:hypothetical protein